jgi:hypothetical protein
VRSEVQIFPGPPRAPTRPQMRAVEQLPGEDSGTRRAAGQRRRLVLCHGESER